MKAIQELEALGYFFRVQGVDLAYEHFGSPPDPDTVRPLLAEVKLSKEEAITYLQERPFTRNTKQVVIFAEDSPLAFPAGTLRRLADGRIKACLTYAEMETMREWRDEIILAVDENG